VTEEDEQWAVQLAPAAVRALEQLPHKVSAAIAEFITATLPTNPHGMTKPLRYELAGWRVARRGDYRITFRTLTDDHTLLIGRVDHRAHAYRRQ
jgi:mRNA-degrading endonuclease RelE of RelBE toxin-antitoxin system